MSASKNLARAVSSAAVVAISGGAWMAAHSNNHDHEEEDETEQHYEHTDRIPNQHHEAHRHHHHQLVPTPSSKVSNALRPWNWNWNWNWNPSILQQQQPHISVCEWGPRRNPTDSAVSSYPDLSRFGAASYLKKYLTPAVYASLQHNTTKNGVCLEDIIRSGVSLPWGAKPPRGTGVYAGDEDSYQVFAELLVPIIEDYHRYHFEPQSQPNNCDDAAASSNNRTTAPRPVRLSTPTTTFVTAMSPAMVSDETTPMHGRSSGAMLRRTFTNLNKHSVLEQKIDPTGEYILQTRMRVARSIKGFPFSPVITRKQRRELERLFETMVAEDWNNTDDDDDENTMYDDDMDDDDDDDEVFGNYHIVNNHGGLKDGKYLRVMDMTNDQHVDLIARHILFHDPDEYNISAGIGRDWPDARGIYVTSSSSSSHQPIEQSPASNNSNNDVVAHNNPDLMIWLNKEDHMRIIATSNGGDLLAVFKRLSRALTQVEQSLHKRGHAFCVHPKYGFVNASPENLGTALRASVYIKLRKLGQQPGFDRLLERLRLESSSRFENSHGDSSNQARTNNNNNHHYTGIFDIANAERLGQSEIQLVNTMINGVGRLIELEKRLEKGETVNLEEVR